MPSQLDPISAITNGTAYLFGDSLKNVVRLRPVSRTDYLFLFSMLKERKPEDSIIFTMPTWSDHVRFVNSKPYTAWYIILYNRTKVGNIYLTKDDEWGYFIKTQYQNRSFGTDAFLEMAKKHPRPYYYANINPKNETAIHQARDKFGGELLKLTYKISREKLFN